MSFEPGAQIGPYRIVKKIGEGGMGSVYLAEHALLGRRAAIKVLLPALSQQREIVDRFFNEARATTAVNDPGIVQVFDFGFHVDQSAYIVMELLEGEPLEHRLQRGAISFIDALRITRQVAGSLAAAHARGIVHRDLKPDNIFMVRDAEAQSGERPKILDFGIAKLSGAGEDRTRTRTGMMMGTPVYMSPEQCRGAGSVDQRSDIYSLGCVLYHLLARRPPFDYEGVGEIISAHLREPPAPPSAYAPGLPPHVDALVLRCLAKSPDERFQTMTELAGACEAQLARITGAGAPTIAAPYVSGAAPTTLSGSASQAGPTGAGTLAPKRRGGVIGAVVLGVAVVGVLATVVVQRASSTAASGAAGSALAPAAAPAMAPAIAPPQPAPPAAPLAATPPPPLASPPPTPPAAPPPAPPASPPPPPPAAPAIAAPAKPAVAHHAPPRASHAPAKPQPAQPAGDLYDDR